MTPQTIEIDCAPGPVRPGDLYVHVIAGLGLAEREPVSTFFGNWTWDYSDVPANEWAAVRPLLKSRITDLYNRGRIRYGSW